MQHKPRHTIHQFDAVQRIASQLFLLFTIQLVVLLIGKIIVSGQQESARAARRIADRHLGLGTHHVDNRRNQGPGRKVLSRSTFHVLGVFLEQPFVGVALHVRGQATTTAPCRSDRRSTAGASPGPEFCSAPCGR